MDSDADGLGNVPMQTPLLAISWLTGYLRADNDTGSIGASLWHSSSVGAIRPTGHNSNYSQVQFDGGAYCFSGVELAAPLEEDGSTAVVPSSSPHGTEIYEVDKPYPIDDQQLNGYGRIYATIFSMSFIEGLLYP